jgi:hypothetical protein
MSAIVTSPSATYPASDVGRPSSSAEIITDLMDLSDLREALWSNDVAGDALLREIRAAGEPPDVAGSDTRSP